MPLLGNHIYDNGLGAFGGAGKTLVLCSAEPADFTAAATTLLLGYSAVTVGAPIAGVPNGRQVVVPAISAGTVNAAGTATHWALVDASRLLATAALAAPLTLEDGGTWSVQSFTIRIPAAIEE